MKIIKYLFCLALITAVFFAVYFFYKANKKLAVSEIKEIVFEISKNQGVNDIAYQLKSQNLISNLLDFEIYVLISGKKSSFKVGEYKLNTAMNIKEITTALTGQPESKERTVTIIEGWNLQNIAEELDKQGIVGKDDFLFAAAQDYSGQYVFLKDKPLDMNLEGYLFPDTYNFFKDSQADVVIKKMLDNFDLKLTSEMRGQIASLDKTVFETVVLASIIEKEVPTVEDRKIVSGIFQSRIEKGIPLGSDATINYITGKKMLQPNFSDLEIDSPYNTYKNLGLPKGPICSPGVGAIEAAIGPEETDYLYFLTDSEGKVIYSKTYQEHLENKAKYLN